MTARDLGTRLGASLRSLVPQRLATGLAGRNRLARGSAELSVVVVSASLVAGVFFGQGLSRTAVDIADGLTWLSDDPSGEIVQVNPATGELEVRQLVGAPGDDLDIAQYDGQLFVTNHTTGQLMSFDLTSILISGQRRVSSGGAVQTLMHDGSVFLVDGEQSTISAIDPVGTDAIGTIWVAPAGLADAAIDEDGTVWALEDDGTLHEMTWSEEAGEFDEADPVQVDLSGPGSVLVSHEQGVTVFGPDQGIIEQEGTGGRISADALKLSGTLLAPESSPDDLVPVAAPDTGTVVIATPDGIREVDMRPVRCDDPGTPEVFRGTVYVPCRGEGRVVQLAPDGARVGEDLQTPGADDPELVLDDETLIVNAPGADQGLVVHGDGKVSSVTRADADVPVSTPSTVELPPTPPPPSVLDDLLGEQDPPRQSSDKDDDSPSATPRDDDGNGGGNGDGDGGGGGNGSSCPADRPQSPACTDQDPVEPEGNPINAPTGVTARALSEGQVEITWEHTTSPKANKFVISSTTGKDYATVAADVRQAVINVTPGERTSFVVTAILKRDEATSVPTQAVVTTARPGAPTVTSSAVYAGDARQQRFVVTVTWTEAAANGSAVSRYDVTIETPDGTMTKTTSGSARSAELVWTCDLVDDPACKVGGDFKGTVVATNALGGGQPGPTSGVAPVQPDPPLPAAGKQLVRSGSPKTSQATLEGDGQITLQLNPATDWRRFTGTCAYELSGGRGAGGGGPVECDARSVTLTYANGYIFEPESADTTHTVTFTATNLNGTSRSATYSFTSTQPRLQEGQQIP